MASEKSGEKFAMGSSVAIKRLLQDVARAKHVAEDIVRLEKLLEEQALPAEERVLLLSLLSGLQQERTWLQARPHKSLPRCAG